MPHYTALVTLLAVAVYFFFATQVARAHGQFGVKLPSMAGHPDFDRVVRGHLNTLEWMPIFLAPLWLCAIYLSDAIAAGLGLVWIIGRLIYFLGYRTSVEKRVPGFLIQVLAAVALFIAAAYGIVMDMRVG